MTCKDCIHYDVCHRRINRIDFLPIINGEIIKTPILFIDCKDVENRCGKFKDKARIIEKPDNVYEVDCERIYESKVKNIIFDTDGIAFDERAIGKSVFLSKKEAEEKLKELKK